MRYANPLLARPSRPLPGRVAVLGAGTIGPDIAYYLAGALPGVELTLVDIEQGRLDSAAARIQAYVEKGLARKKLTGEQAASLAQAIKPTLDYDRLAGADLVIEAVTENLELKRQIFERIEAIVDDEAIITSNTSALPASWLFEGMARPQRATVTHFFAPAFRNPIVEVVDWEGSAPEVIEHLRRLFAATGKVPLVTADVPCFMLDRVFDNWCNEAGHLLALASAAEIDEVAGEFVHAGPFFVLNLANGNPIIVETNTLQAEQEGDHYRPAPIFSSVGDWVTVPPGSETAIPALTAATVRDRLLGILFSQTADILDRGIGDPADLELGCELALGFKKGPVRLMGESGEVEAARILGRLAEERPGMPMPARDFHAYRPSLRHLLVDDVDGVKVITIRRPGALNALDDEVNDELLAVLERFETDDSVDGFVITGYGTRAFCAGADITRFVAMLGDFEASIQYARDCSRVLLHLDAMTKPVVAAVNGMALGGGLELAFRCHCIVAVSDAWLQLPEVTLGLAPGIGGLVVPYRRWPDAAPVFHGMLRQADRLDAGEAYRLGVIDALASDVGELLDLAVNRARELGSAAGPPGEEPVEIPPLPPLDPARLEGGLDGDVIAIIDDAIRRAAGTDGLKAALEIGYAAFAETACSDTARDRITSFAGGGKG